MKTPAGNPAKRSYHSMTARGTGHGTGDEPAGEYGRECAGKSRRKRCRINPDESSGARKSSARLDVTVPADGDCHKHHRLHVSRGRGQAVARLRLGDAGAARACDPRACREAAGGTLAHGLRRVGDADALSERRGADRTDVPEGRAARGIGARAWPMAAACGPGRGAAAVRDRNRARNGAIQAQPHASGLRQTFVARYPLNLPRLADVVLLHQILGNHGYNIMSAGKRPGDREHQGQTLHISAANIIDTTAHYDLVSKMRASFWVIGPLLARMKQAKVSLPGGCAIGTRPVDLLIMALEKLGAEIVIDGGYAVARAPQGQQGATIDFTKVTVRGTPVAQMAATLAKGTTVITNAACEPEITDVADCLNKMGAKVTGAGTPRITIEGVAKLHGARHAVLPDRIETGTYAKAVEMPGGDVQLQGARPALLQTALDVLTQAGATITVTNDGIRVTRNGAGINPVEVSTAPFPGFP